MLVVAIGICVQLSGLSLQAQSEEKFKIRLFSAPPSGTQVPNVAGAGSASAVLTGKNFRSRARSTSWHPRRQVPTCGSAQLTGVRGNSLFDLTSRRPEPELAVQSAGTFDLTPDQVDALKKGKLVCPDSERGHAEWPPAGLAAEIGGPMFGLKKHITFAFD